MESRMEMEWGINHRDTENMEEAQRGRIKILDSNCFG